MGVCEAVYQPPLQNYMMMGVPDDPSCAIALYLAHVHQGQSLRSLARATGLNPSTVLRRVRKLEDRRDDPLIDEFLSSFSQAKHSLPIMIQEGSNMVSDLKEKPKKSKKTLTKQEQSALRRLCETGAFLAIGKDLAKGAIFRTKEGSEPTRFAVVSKETAKALVVRDCIKLTKNEKLSIYHVTEVGRTTIRRIVKAQINPAAQFGDQHRDWGEREVSDTNHEDVQKIRVNLRESPLSALARKKDAKGKPFLSKELLDAGERLREDFELAQMGPRVAQNWDRFVNGGGRGVFADPGENGSHAAHKRMHNAMQALGEGLWDIVLRCCCCLEGLEAAEKRMGWSARSGKIVLRIALQRLRLHYDSPNTLDNNMIG